MLSSLGGGSIDRNSMTPGQCVMGIRAREMSRGRRLALEAGKSRAAERNGRQNKENLCSASSSSPRAIGWRRGEKRRRRRHQAAWSWSPVRDMVLSDHGVKWQMIGPISERAC